MIVPLTVKAAVSVHPETLLPVFFVADIGVNARGGEAYCRGVFRSSTYAHKRIRLTAQTSC
jgi:hypothetical protein